MPYIEDFLRDTLADELRQNDIMFTPRSAGELNYIISKFADNMLRNDMNYAKLNEIIGALECAKLELYRRVAAPYEDIKIDSNGDVYQCIDDAL